MVNENKAGNYFWWANAGNGILGSSWVLGQIEAGQAMDEWAKQALGAFLVEVKEMREQFEKEKKQLLDLLEPQLRQVFRYKLYGGEPRSDSQMIDEWYERYIKKYFA